MAERNTDARPLEPVHLADMFRSPARARLVLVLSEDGEPYASARGWARIDGSWVHWLDDRYGFWSSWPAAQVHCLDWEVPA